MKITDEQGFEWIVFTLNEIKEAEKRYLSALKEIYGDCEPEDYVERWESVAGHADYCFPDFSTFLANEKEWIQKEKRKQQENEDYFFPEEKRKQQENEE